MSVKDVIKKSILNSDAYSTYDIGNIALALFIALLLGILI